MTDINELREKVAKVIGHTACLGNYGINNAWEVADAAIATVMEATGWQDIATAPRDGAHVAVYAALNCSGKKRRSRRGCELSVAHFESGWGWLSTPGDYQLNPTHWMPLPPPPFEGTKHD